MDLLFFVLCLLAAAAGPFVAPSSSSSPFFSPTSGLTTASLLSSAARLKLQKAEKMAVHVPGDIVLGGLFPMHENNISRRDTPCGTIKEEKGIQVGSGKEGRMQHMHGLAVKVAALEIVTSTFCVLFIFPQMAEIGCKWQGCSRRHCISRQQIAQLYKYN
jgi:hypothetical protein